MVEHRSGCQSGLRVVKGLLAGWSPNQFLGVPLKGEEKRREVLRGVGYKASVVVEHSEISTELLDTGGRFCLSDCGHPFWEGPDAVPVYVVAQEF